jgi:hypothetical protein
MPPKDLQEQVTFLVDPGFNLLKEAPIWICWKKGKLQLMPFWILLTNVIHRFECTLAR